MLLRRGTTEYRYDARGRRTAKIALDKDGKQQTTLYDWDGRDRLRRILRPDGVQLNYSYDAFGRRVHKIGGGELMAVTGLGALNRPSHIDIADGTNCDPHTYVNPQFTIKILGSGLTRNGEFCDNNSGTTADPQVATGDSEDCDRDCTTARCGDAHINALAGEECELAYVDAGKTPVATATCDITCKKKP